MYHLPLLAPRKPDAHKGDFGRALLIGGSYGMAGAIGLAGMSCLRSGAGLVRLAVADHTLPLVSAFDPCYMTTPLSCEANREFAMPSVIDELLPVTENATCVAIGPGLGRSETRTRIVQHLYERLTQPLVVDADGLNALADIAQRNGRPPLHPGPRILTPHPGEFSRLANQKFETRDEQIAAAKQLAKDWDVVLVLKGQHTLITDGERHELNYSGNPGMATGGSGDVLTGIITALVCQQLSPFDAALLGCMVHGMAGDIAADDVGEVSLIATDIIEFLPDAFAGYSRASASSKRKGKEKKKGKKGKNSKAESSTISRGQRIPLRIPNFTSRTPPLKLFRQSSPLPSEFLRGAIAVGNFDGVHRGHAKLVERLLARAREVNGPAVVLTFDPHPVRILRPELAPPPLTWTERKAELLAELGVTAVWSYPTDEALLKLTATEFFEQIICDALQARAMVEGPNFQFGKQRQGNVDLLQKLSDSKGLSLEIVQPIATEGELVSSSRVRESIKQGDVTAARQMLTRPYRLRGLVTHGAQRGAKIGFPTANLAGIDTLVPPVGVYAGRAFTQQGIWPAAINIGPNPTFGEGAFKFEAHLPGFSGSLYGQPLEVEFLARVRETRPFESVAALTQQLAADVQTVLKHCQDEAAEDA